MFKAAVLFAVCLLALANATTSVEEISCSPMPACYSRHAGLYYLYVSSSKYSWYVLLNLRSDSSYTWTASNQSGARELEASEILYQPFSDANGKYRCDATEASKIEMKDFAFMFATKNSPNMYLNHNLIRLNMENPKQITGTFRFRTYNMNTTHLAEALTMQGEEYSNLQRDVVGETFDFTVKGERLDRTC